ncbi:homocysteine biosynthesis protein [Desulfoluna butyratoxydans]|uniref:Homocysteine biosynthesis enzyme sulfur-incorporation n=1 Tax=Desulfoluna butyratoxydans TaxID=231438 RepID=A0A4V6IM35_9BACT|nr:homocysteine biosynthesis protein [Desulfoluna butyratoxydans]VFQ47278.1 homocysteine biosynthesis enzyme sulfur-incorporation [Desulfoluna butyratoxydans]
MGKTFKVEKTYEEINARIKSGDVVVVTAEEMIGIVDEKGPEEAARQVDVVTTGTFAPMCSSGAFLNIGQSTPSVRTTSTWFNNVPAYSGVAAVDCYLGATAVCDDDPLNKVYPGEFRYGGGHVIEDLVAGKTVYIRADSYGTACYPNLHVEKEMTLEELPSAVLCNPRNAYQNYNCAVNPSDKTIYTYMGTLKPKMGNANYCSAGELSPLLNDPLYKTIGFGTRIFLGGAQGYVAGPGTQHRPGNPRGENDVPLSPAGTIWAMGDLKKMSPEWLRGVSMRGYGCSLSVGLGIPIPILNEEMARYTAVRDEEIFTQVVDYSDDYPNGVSRSLGQVSYKELKSGSITVNGETISTVPLSSMVKARAVAETLKGWIQRGEFLLGVPQELLPVE